LKETALPILQPIGCLLGQTLFEREESYVNRPTHFTAYRLFAWPNFVQKRGVLCKPLSNNNRAFFPLSKNVAKIKVFIEATPKCRPAQPVYAKEK